MLPSVLLFGTLLLSCTRQPVYPAPAVSSGDVIIEIAQLKPDVPQFYTYRFQDRNISFFVISLDGRISSFFDACASCYRHRMGYRYERDDAVVTCRYCGMRFPVYKLEKGIGGCYPIKLEGKVLAGKYHIPAASLEAEAGKF